MDWKMREDFSKLSKNSAEEKNIKKKTAGSVSFRSGKPQKKRSAKSTVQTASYTQAEENTQKRVNAGENRSNGSVRPSNVQAERKKQASDRTSTANRTRTVNSSPKKAPVAKRKAPVKKSRRNNRLTGLLLRLVIFAVVLVGGIYLMLNKSFAKMTSHTLDMEQISVNAVDSKIKGYTNIALFGIDSQDNVIGDKGSRSDSIIVASINNRTKAVKLMSIYRDTYVSINGQYDKINAAYSYGGPELAISTINRNLDLNITDFVTVNFKALADAVDAVGGIPLTIKSEKELKNLNDYIGNMNKINGGDSKKFDEVGSYTFDGNQAVAYARIRYMEGGDHERANHQRLVLQGIVNQLKKKPWKAKALIDKVLPQCKTSFTPSKLSKLALGAPFYKISDSQAYPFHSQDEKYGGIYYGFPLTVYSNVQQAHEYLFGTKDYEPTEELGKISQKVKNKTDEIGIY